MSPIAISGDGAELPARLDRDRAFEPDRDRDPRRSKAAAGARALAQFCVDPLFRAVNVEFSEGPRARRRCDLRHHGGRRPREFASRDQRLELYSQPDRRLDRDRARLRAHRPGVRRVLRGERRRRPDGRLAPDDAAPHPRDPARRRSTITASTGGRRCSEAHIFVALADARMALNINSDRAETAKTRAPADQLYLYNSDRISQLMGCGLLTLSFRMNQLMELFDEDQEMVVRGHSRRDARRRVAVQTRRSPAPRDRRGGLAQVARASERAARRALYRGGRVPPPAFASLYLADDAMVTTPARSPRRSASCCRAARASAFEIGRDRALLP